MGRPAKKPVTSSKGAHSVPVQTDSSAKNQNKSSAAAPTEEEDIIIESAPAQPPEESNTHVQTEADENLQTKPKCKQTNQTFDEIKKRLNITSANLNVIRTVLDALPTGLDGPISVMAEQMKNMNANIQSLNQEIINICDIKHDTIDIPPPPSSYSEALKRTGDTVASIQRS